MKVAAILIICFLTVLHYGPAQGQADDRSVTAAGQDTLATPPLAYTNEQPLATILEKIQQDHDQIVETPYIENLRARSWKDSPPNDATAHPNNALLHRNDATIRPNNATLNPNNATLHPNDATLYPNDAKRNPN
jgi:hypothetical protein